MPLIVFLTLILIVFYVLFSPSKVDGDSMEPSLSHGDRLLLTKSYETPRRGDVIAFHIAGAPPRAKRALKRVVAVPGDSVEVREGIATVNGVRESGDDVIADQYFRKIVGPLIVPSGTVFVLGDNRMVSLDSRQLGPVALDSVVGRVVWVWAPVTRIGPPD